MLRNTESQKQKQHIRTDMHKHRGAAADAQRCTEVQMYRNTESTKAQGHINTDVHMERSIKVKQHKCTEAHENRSTDTETNRSSEAQRQRS